MIWFHDLSHSQILVLFMLNVCDPCHWPKLILKALVQVWASSHIHIHITISHIHIHITLSHIHIISVRSITFLPFTVPIFVWNVPFISWIFLKRSLVFSILLFSSISFHWSLRKASLSLLGILWNSAFRWVYLSFSPLPFTSLLFSAIFKASSDNHFAFLHFFFLEMVLITASYTLSQTSIPSSSGTLSNLISWICLSLPLYNHKWFDLAHTWMV